MNIIVCFYDRCRLRVPVSKAVWTQGKYFCCRACMSAWEKKEKEVAVSGMPVFSRLTLRWQNLQDRTLLRSLFSGKILVLQVNIIYMISDDLKTKLISAGTLFITTFVIGVATTIQVLGHIEWSLTFWSAVVLAGANAAVTAVAAYFVPVRLGGKRK